MVLLTDSCIPHFGLKPNNDSDLLIGVSEMMNDKNIKPCFTWTCDCCENYDYSDLSNDVHITINLGGIKR